VSLGPREIKKRRTVARFGHDPNVDLQAGAQNDGGARRSMRQDLADVLISYQPFADGGAVLRRYQDVEITDGIAATAIAACHNDMLAIAQKGDERVSLGFRHP
jgi:hypothetical protein